MNLRIFDYRRSIEQKLSFENNGNNHEENHPRYQLLYPVETKNANMKQKP